MKSPMTRLFAMFLVLALFCASASAQETKTKSGDDVKPHEIGETRNVHACGDLFCAGQFTEDDIDSLKENGIKRVISLRTEGEIEWDEAALLKEAEIEFVSVPFRKPETLTDDVFDEIRELLRDDDSVTMLHCGSANRVGAVWLTYRVLDQGVDVETALEEAKKIGLRNEDYEARALDYIGQVQNPDDKEESVKPGINESFLDPDLDVARYVERFEVESREIFASRQAIIDACQIKGHWAVADIGAGTGLFTKIFSDVVGDGGHVFAVDISQKFIDHIDQQAKEHDLDNISAVLCKEDSVELEPNSIHIAFICDTYHHFEYPKSTMESIFHAMKPGGTLILIDFHRIPGQTREWLLDHVRAGQEVFRAEVEAAGFEFVEEVKIEGLEENYFLRFKK